MSPSISILAFANVHVNSNKIKKELGEEVRGSRVTGLLLTPEESYMVYCSEGGFLKIEVTERQIKKRLISRLFPQSRERSELKDIVLCPSLKNINGLLFNCCIFSSNAPDTKPMVVYAIWCTCK